jgi:hypothetical protein
MGISFYDRELPLKEPDVVKEQLISNAIYVPAEIPPIISKVENNRVCKIRF